MTAQSQPGTRTRHVCLSCSLACSGVNQCVLCDAVIKQNVLAIALQRTGLSLEQANFFYQAYDDAFNWLHEQMLQDPRVDDCALDLSRVTIAPLPQATQVPWAPRMQHQAAAQPPPQAAAQQPQPPQAPQVPKKAPASPQEEPPPMVFESEIRPDPEQVEMAQAALEQFEQAMQDPEFVAFMMSAIPGLQAKMQGQVIEATPQVEVTASSPIPEIETAASLSPASRARPAAQERSLAEIGTTASLSPETSASLSPASRDRPAAQERSLEAQPASQARSLVALSTPIDADTIASAGVPIDIADIPSEREQDETPGADHLNGSGPGGEPEGERTKP